MSGRKTERAVKFVSASLVAGGFHVGLDSRSRHRRPLRARQIVQGDDLAESRHHLLTKTFKRGTVALRVKNRTTHDSLVRDQRRHVRVDQAQHPQRW